MNRAALTLVEVLVALALSSIVVGLAMATTSTVRRVQGVVDARTIDTARTTAVPPMLEWAVGRAGRGLDGCGVEVVGTGDVWRTSAHDRGATAAATVEVLAGRDAAGRPALYHRTLPWARQPWIEDVASFRVLAVRDEAGAWRHLAPDGATRWHAVRIELSWTDGDARTYDVALPHAPCAVAR